MLPLSVARASYHKGGGVRPQPFLRLAAYGMWAELMGTKKEVHFGDCLAFCLQLWCYYCSVSKPIVYLNAVRCNTNIHYLGPVCVSTVTET